MEKFYPHCANREINTEKKKEKRNYFHIRWSWTDCKAGNRPEHWGAKIVGFWCLLVLPSWDLQQTAVVNAQKDCRGTQKILWLLGIFSHEIISFWFTQFFVWLKKYSKPFEIAYRQIHCYYVFKYINIYIYWNGWNLERHSRITMLLNDSTSLLAHRVGKGRCNLFKNSAFKLSYSKSK